MRKCCKTNNVSDVTIETWPMQGIRMKHQCVSRWSVGMQFAPAKVSITQFVLSFLCNVSDAVSSKQYNAAYIFAIFVVIVEVEAKINSCISHLKNRNLKNVITCTKIEKYASKFS